MSRRRRWNDTHPTSALGDSGATTGRAGPLTRGMTITIPAEDRFDASHDTDLLLTEDPVVHPDDDWIRVRGVDLGAAGPGAGRVTDGVVTLIVHGSRSGSWPARNGRESVTGSRRTRCARGDSS